MDSDTASPTGANNGGSGSNISHDNNGLTSPGPTRKRSRDNETDGQRQKREKAAARQRRKRERDKEANGVGPGQLSHPGLPGELLAVLNSTRGLSDSVEHDQQEQELIHQGFLQQHLASANHSAAPSASVQTESASSSTGGGGGGDYGAGESEAHELTPEESARRDRVRAGARERQRKHRAMLKQKKMRELGLDMGHHPHIQHPGHPPPHPHEMVGHHGGMEEHHPLPHYLPPPHELTGGPPGPPGHPGVHSGLTGHGHPPHHAMVPISPHSEMVPHEPPFPQGPPLGGQTFASTLLLSFSCAPMLKEHLLRSLAMTNEELASLEPIIADAWDQWDSRRRIHYAEQAARNGTHHGLPPAPYPLDISQEPPSSTNPFASTGNSATTPGSTGPSLEGAPTNEFRARFLRPLVAPSPFRTTYAPVDSQGATETNNASVASAADSTDSSSATTGSNGLNESIDPNLRSGSGGAKDVVGENAGDDEDDDSKDDMNLDPELSGQTGAESNGEN